MAHDDGPAPVTTFLRRLACAAMLLVALPLLAQSRDPGILTQDLLTKCQDVFISCGKACFGEMCKVCEEARDVCRAEVYSNVGIPKALLPPGWPPSGMLTPTLIPAIPGLSNSTAPRPFPWLTLPVLTPTPAAPPPQSSTHCDPRNYDEILQRHRDQEGVPPPDLLLAQINSGLSGAEASLETWNKIASAPGAGFLDRQAAKEQIAKAEHLRDFLKGASKLIGELSSTGTATDTALIALSLTLDRALDEKRGLTDRGGVASASVWIFGSDASVIRDGSPSYHDKQNALGEILARYGSGDGIRGVDDDDPLPQLRELADITAHDSLIAACRAESLIPPDTAGGSGSSLGECNGKPLESVKQCCTADGIGSRVAKTEKTIVDCPIDKRSAKPKPYKPVRNGCGVPLTDFFFGDMPDNPNFFRLPPRFVGKRVYFGPSFFPACDFHDDCWGTCHTPETGLSQEVCDTEFGDRLSQICESANLNFLELAKCESNAWRYQKLVQLGAFALGKYDAGQADGCDCCEGGAD